MQRPSWQRKWTSFNSKRQLKSYRWSDLRVAVVGHGQLSVMCRRGASRSTWSDLPGTYERQPLIIESCWDGTAKSLLATGRRRRSPTVDAAAAGRHGQQGHATSRRWPGCQWRHDFSDKSPSGPLALPIPRLFARQFTNIINPFLPSVPIWGQWLRD